MAEKRKSNAVGKGITPKCVLVFPYLNSPDTKFNKDGEYRTKARFDGESAAEFVAKLEQWHTAAIEKMVEEQKAKAKTPEAAKKITAKSIKKAQDLPWKAETDENGDETGAILVSFKQKAQVTVKKEGEEPKVYKKHVDLFDAAKVKFPKDKLIYGGTTAKIAFEALPFYTPSLGAGLTLRLNAVQVLDLVTNGPKNADAYGFGEEGEGLGETETTSSEGDEADEAGAGEESADF